MAGAIDEDTRRAVASGRETLGAMLSNAQKHLQKAFIVFVVGLVGSIYLLRKFVWDMLKADLNTNPNINVIAVTPFDVILLQAKIGVMVGLLLALPVLVYLSRDALRERGWWPDESVSRWKLAVLSGFIVTLFLAGASYAYFVFFPTMFDFLASNAVQSGFQPSWSIVKWAQFIFLLTVSFGLAAQLPLAMSVLAYGEVVAYETFRDKWRHAVVAIFVFGAMFSPPDPFTQIMWAVPLIGLYAFSLGLTKLVVLTKRSGETVDFRALASKRWNSLAGTAVLAFGAVYGFFTQGGVAAINGLLSRYGISTLPTVADATGLSTTTASALLGSLVAVVAVGVVLFYFATEQLEGRLAATGTGGADPASVGAPSKIDLEEIPAEGVRAAPPEVFEQLSEEEAAARADRALDAGDEEKARAILDRFDEVQERDGGGEATGREGESESDVITETTTGIVDAFTEEETTEEDIGGYYTDIAFIFESLTSKSFRIAGTFMAVMTATFIFLYYGGIRTIKEAFLGRLPPEMVDKVDLVTLHPVEALVFEVKFASLVGLVATLPLVLYYVWPALKERGIAGGDRRVLLVWGGTLVAGLVAGGLFGFLYVAPTVISWLAYDALRAHMVIAYRINNFGWLVIATTVGIGLLAEIPVSMFLFHRGGLVSFQRMYDSWRGVVFGIFVFSMFVTPQDLFTLLMVAIPLSLSYLAGLGLLWVYTLGGRRSRSGTSEPAD